MSYEKMNNEMRGLSDPKKVNISNMIYMLYSIGTKKASIYFRIYNKYIGNTIHTEISLEVRIRDIIDSVAIYSINRIMHIYHTKPQFIINPFKQEYIRVFNISIDSLILFPYLDLYFMSSNKSTTQCLGIHIPAIDELIRITYKLE